MPLTFIFDQNPDALCAKVKEIADKDDILQIDIQSISPVYHIAWMRVRKGKKTDRVKGKKLNEQAKKDAELKEDPLSGLADLFGGI